MFLELCIKSLYVKACVCTCMCYEIYLKMCKVMLLSVWSALLTPLLISLFHLQLLYCVKVGQPHTVSARAAQAGGHPDGVNEELPILMKIRCICDTLILFSFGNITKQM